MASGRDTQLTKQIGEHTVAAMLGRMGYIAAPFAGNIPLYDLLAADEQGNTIPVQVKTIKSGSWQFSITAFLDIEIKGDRQKVLGKKKGVNPALVCVLMKISEKGDEFYVLRFKDLQDHFFRTYKGGVRRNNPQSMHCAIWPKDIKDFEGNWKLVKASFKSAKKI